MKIRISTSALLLLWNFKILASKAIDFTNCTSSNGKFACSDNSKCIDIGQTCNKNKDCPDGSDENPRYCESL